MVAMRKPLATKPATSFSIKVVLPEFEYPTRDRMGVLEEGMVMDAA